MKKTLTVSFVFLKNQKVEIAVISFKQNRGYLLGELSSPWRNKTAKEIKGLYFLQL